MKAEKIIKKADILIILAVIICSVLLFFAFNRSSDSSALIIIDGETVYETDISKVAEPFTLDLENGITVLIAKNEISVIASDCFGKNCISCGRLTHPGDTAVCIPNKTVIKLSGTAEKAPDAVTY